MVLRILMFPLVLLLFLYVAIAQVVPTYQSIKSAEVSKELKEEELIEAQDELAEVDAFIQGIKAHPAEREFVSTFVPSEQKEELLINDIWQIAEDSKGQDDTFNLFSIGFSDEGAKNKRSPVRETRLIEGRAIVSGTYDEFQRFIDQMFRFNRMYAFKTIDITKPDKSENDDEEGPQILSGSVVFAYSYSPESLVMNTATLANSIDYDLINTISDSVAEKDPLDSQSEERSNPFLP